MSNCRNCGAPINLNQCACAYCNTPYSLDVLPDPFDIDTNKFIYLTEKNRSMMHSKRVMELYDEAIKAVHILYADNEPIVMIGEG